MQFFFILHITSTDYVKYKATSKKDLFQDTSPFNKGTSV